MFKIALCMVFCLSACDYQLSQAREFKWASIDKSKIQASILQDLKIRSPYPAEIVDTEESVRERKLAAQQASKLELEARQKCVEMMPPDKKGAQQQKDSALTDQASMFMGTIHSPGQPRMDMRRDFELRNNKQYQACISEIANDPLIKDLRGKGKVFEDKQKARRTHDEKLRTKANELVDLSIAEYGKEHNFEIIVTNSPNSVAYNGSKLVLDVTADVLANLEQNNPSSVLQGKTTN